MEPSVVNSSVAVAVLSVQFATLMVLGNRRQITRDMNTPPLYERNDEDNESVSIRLVGWKRDKLRRTSFSSHSLWYHIYTLMTRRIVPPQDYSLSQNFRDAAPYTCFTITLPPLNYRTTRRTSALLERRQEISLSCCSFFARGLLLVLLEETIFIRR